MAEAFIPPSEYPGDEVLEKILKAAGAQLSVFEVYGLFYGCLVAPRIVMPSSYIPLIIGENAVFNSDEQAREAVACLMGLWNFLAHWDPGSGEFPFPYAEYPATREGLKRRIRNDASMIEYFQEGLALGETRDEDLSKDAAEALDFLLQIYAHLEKYRASFDTEDDGEIPFEESGKLLDKVEDSIADHIARIHLGLKAARKKAAQKGDIPRSVQEKKWEAAGTKVGRNDPCPCGSGRKYKKCCGLVH